MSQFFASGSQSIGVSASTSVSPMNTQDWSPLRCTGWISLQSKGLSRVFNTTVQKQQFFGAQPSLWSNSHIHTWLYGPLLAIYKSVQFSSVVQSCPTLCDPMHAMNLSNTPGLPVHHQLQESTQTHIHWVGDAIQPSHPLPSPSFPAFNLSQHQGLFKWVSSSHQVAIVLEFQLQHQSFQWTPRTDLL